ncbi:FAD:protein FMN transferase [Methylomonas rhizoryzae]|uniref:FAD:protein FMN transferase n=1 Tax=Methylomonas rhizoryzae TaxID=2608981 RepID=UPI001E462855|nr:FAD:protein FMN transferase [Methylomonas rhizoryzae]
MPRVRCDSVANTGLSKFLAWFLIVFFATACSERVELQKFEGFTQGTTYHISYWSEPAVDARNLQQAVAGELERIDNVLSNYRADSLIESFNNSESNASQEVGPEIVSLVKIAASVTRASQGCYDLTIKPLFDLWGFKDDVLNIPDQAMLSGTLANVGMDKVEVVDDTHLRKPAQVRVDVSSIAQGYSVERISRVMEQNGVRNYLVEIGGELKTQGRKPDGGAWRIAVEKPLPDQQRMSKVLSMPTEHALAVMTSGTYRHYFDVNGKRYSHVLDAGTGKPVSHDLVSVTVLHEDPTLADALSTALLCVGQQQAMQWADAERIKVLFVQQQGDRFVETKSQALAASGLSIE